MGSWIHDGSLDSRWIIGFTMGSWIHDGFLDILGFAIDVWIHDGLADSPWIVGFVMESGIRGVFFSRWIWGLAMMTICLIYDGFLDSL